ncbi:hypothetical protein BGZ83_011043 [Gryganskiella cystojenkinii]|nr:hypothetical protein BGZ83_011043 [Gryganskiella cystojenkinii]
MPLKSPTGPTLDGIDDHGAEEDGWGAEGNSDKQEAIADEDNNGQDTTAEDSELQ